MPGVGLVHPSMHPADGDPPATGTGVAVAVARGLGVGVLVGEGVGSEAVAFAGVSTRVGRLVTRGTVLGGSVVMAIGSW
ncbi:MAG: hypothetical protein ACR2H0_02395 [Candidatus Limnocylindrales bacterium]